MKVQTLGNVPFKLTQPLNGSEHKYRKLGFGKKILRSFLEDLGVPSSFFPGIKRTRQLGYLWCLNNATIYLPKPFTTRFVIHEGDHCFTDLEISNALHGLPKKEINELLIKIFERRTRLGLEGPNIISHNEDFESWLCIPKFNTKKMRTEIAALMGKLLREKTGVKIISHEIESLLESNPDFTEAYGNEEAFYAVSTYLLSRKNLYYIVKDEIETLKKKLPGEILNLTQEEKQRVISRVLVHIPEIIEAHELEHIQSSKTLNKAYRIVPALESLDKELVSEKINPEEYLQATKHLANGQSKLEYSATINDIAPAEYLGGHLERKATLRGLLVADSEGERVTPSDYAIQRYALLLYRRAQKLTQVDGMKLNAALKETAELKEKKYPKSSFQEALEKLKKSNKLSPETMKYYEAMRQYLDFIKIKRTIKRLRPNDSWNKENLQQDLTSLLSLKCIGSLEVLVDSKKIKALIMSAEQALLEEDMFLAQLRIKEALRYSPKNKAATLLSEVIDDNLKLLKCQAGSSVTIKYSAPIHLTKRLVICKFDDLPQDVQRKLNPKATRYCIIDTSTGKNIELKNDVLIRIDRATENLLQQAPVNASEEITIQRSKDTIFVESKFSSFLL